MFTPPALLSSRMQLNLKVIEACDGRAGLEAYLQHGSDVAMVFMVCAAGRAQARGAGRKAVDSIAASGRDGRWHAQCPAAATCLLRPTCSAPPPRCVQDIMMPVCNGIQAVLSIRSAESRRGWLPVPIVAFTSEDVARGSPLWRECMQSGFNDVVVSAPRRVPLCSARRLGAVGLRTRCCIADGMAASRHGPVLAGAVDGACAAPQRKGRTGQTADAGMCVGSSPRLCTSRNPVAQPKPMDKRYAVQLLCRWMPGLQQQHAPPTSPSASSPRSGASSDEGFACSACASSVGASASCSRCSSSSAQVAASLMQLPQPLRQQGVAGGCSTNDGGSSATVQHLRGSEASTAQGEHGGAEQEACSPGRLPLG